jgi:hypothetical protein
MDILTVLSTNILLVIFIKFGSSVEYALITINYFFVSHWICIMYFYPIVFIIFI